jgi:two-component system sensor histidine kinase CpxA
MARYLAMPAGTLQRATRRLADGDLSARVGPAMGRRRDELADLGHDFDRMASRLENLVLSERRLLADISHELRSPLTRLQVALELARQDAGTKAQPSLCRIEEEADKLNGLIGQLLTLTRLENGLPGGATAPVDLECTLRKITADADFEANATGKSVTLTTCAPAWTHGDADLLHRAVENVVRNAVRYTALNTAVELELREIETDEGHFALIQVRDYGPGVPESELDAMFRPFYRVNVAREMTSGGVGLGLSITDRAVRLHNGTVRAINAEGGGLLVEIQLPLLCERVAVTAN